MSFFSRGFHGRRRQDADAARVPPGQYVTNDFPVPLGRPDAAHATRGVDVLDRRGRRAAREVAWEEFRALPSETATVDIHCVTRWSKLDTSWEGVSVDTLPRSGSSAAWRTRARSLRRDRRGATRRLYSSFV